MSHHATDHDEPHIVPDSLFTKIFLILVVLTVITVAASWVNFGSQSINFTVAMIIASIKALLVALWFMHLKYEDKMTWLFAGIPFFLLIVMFGGIMIDNSYRTDPVDGLGLKDRAAINAAEKAAKHAEAH